MKKPKSKPVQRGIPMFLYTSMCCGALAEKSPCTGYGSVSTKTGTLHVTVARGKEAETQGLGSWRCPTCRKACSVQRTKNAEIVKTNPLDIA